MTPDRMAKIHARAMTQTRGWNAAEFTDLLKQKGVFSVDEEQGFAIGRAIAGEAELLTLAVDPSFQRQGAGRRLLEDFARAARELDAGTLFLEVSAENEAAIALYLSAGFSICGRRRNYYATQDGKRVDAIVMNAPALLGKPSGNTENI